MQQRKGFRPNSTIDGFKVDGNTDRVQVVRDAVTTISDPGKMREFRDELARFIRDEDPNFHKEERDSLLAAEKSIRGALAEPGIRHNQFMAWSDFLRENATPSVDPEVSPSLPSPARR